MLVKCYSYNMISLGLLWALFVLINLVSCHEGKGKGFRECMEKNNIDPKDFHRYSRQLSKTNPDDLGQDFLCTMKCIWELNGEIENGKPDLEKMKQNQFIREFIDDQDGYYKCISEIDSVKDCSDSKKILKCTKDFGNHHIEECAKETDLAEEKWFEWNEKHRGPHNKENKEEPPREIKCFKKCLFEKQGIITDKGSIDTKKVEGSLMMMGRVKNKDEYFKCLEDLQIKECEDVNKIWHCKKDKA